MFIALRIVTVVIASAALGAGYIELYRPNLDWIPSDKQIEIEDIRRDDQKAMMELEEQIVAKAGIDTERLISLLEAGALVIDGRSPEDFEAGHLDAPFITNVTPEAMVTEVFVLESLFFNEPPVPIVLYCLSRECDDSKTSYVTLQDAFKDLSDLSSVYIYLDGWVGIEAAKLPIATGPALPLDQLVNEALIGQQMDDEFASEMINDPNQGVFRDE